MVVTVAPAQQMPLNGESNSSGSTSHTASPALETRAAVTAAAPHSAFCAISRGKKEKMSAMCVGLHFDSIDSLASWNPRAPRFPVRISTSPEGMRDQLT